MNNRYVLQNGLNKYFKSILDNKNNDVVITDKALQARLFFNKREAAKYKSRLWDDYRKDFVIITI